MNQELFLRRATKVHVPVGSGGATRAQVASAIQEIAAFHCILSESVIERIGMLSADELARWLRDMLGVLRRRVGAHVQHQPFYPGFPEQVLKASKAELYLTAVMHYLTLRRLPAHEHARPPLLEGKLVPWLIELGRVAEFESLLAPLVSSRTSLSEVDAADVAWFIRQYRGDVFRLLPGDVPFREIRALVGGALVQHVAGDARVDEFLDRNVETATDALRLAVALSGGDVSLTTATTRFAPMKRGVRRLLLRLLDRAPNAVEDVMRHAERWKRLAEVLHPGDYADKYPRALAAITAARRNDAPASFGSRVETLLAQRHIAALTPLLQQRPGEFARRLDVTLRRSTEPGAVLDAFETVAAQASTPILLQVLAQAGAAPLPLRAFTPRAHWPRSTASRIAVSRWRPKCWRARPGSARTRSSSASPRCRRWAAASSTRAARLHRAAGAARRIEVIAYAGARQSPAAAGHALHPPVPVVEERPRAHGHRPVRRFLRRQFRVHADGRVLQPEGLRRLPQRRHRRRPARRLGVHRPGHRRPRRERHPLRRHVDQLLHPAAVLRPARVLRRLDGPRRSGLGRSVRATHGGRPDRHRVGHADLPALRDGSAGTPRDLGRPGADVHAALEQCAEQSERGVLDAAGIGAYAPAGSGDAV